MIWITTGLVLSVVYIVLLKLRNVFVIPFYNKNNKTARKPTKSGEAFIYFIVLTLCGPGTLLGIVCILVVILLEMTNHLKLPKWVNKDL